MTMDQLRHFFGWCALFNIGVFILWFLLCVTARPLLMDLSRRYFHVSEEAYDKGMFYGITFYKLSIILFMLTPYLTLRVLK